MRSSRLSSRASSRQLAQPVPTPVAHHTPVPQPASSQSPQLVELRRQWKWAAVSQFFHTFAQLIALDDISLVDIEDDLVNSTMRVLPRLMYRLLVTLTQDRKMTLDTWQSSLRRQYLRRDPTANPIGEESSVKIEESRDTTMERDIKSEGANGEGNESEGQAEPERSTSDLNQEKESKSEENREDSGKPDEEEDGSETNSNEEPPLEQPKDWADLSMLQKLESMHTVMEWHFHNPTRLRQLMKSDDEYASWRVEPIGYDAKQNAYWYIGIDRLWIQRARAKPRKKSGKKKVANKSKSSKKASSRKSSSPAKANSSRHKHEEKIVDDEEDDFAVIPSTPSRSARSAKKLRKHEEQTPQTSSRSRAAKTRANAILDIQAKEFEAIKNEMRSFSRGRVPRGMHDDSASAAASRSPRPLGTRISKRLRGSIDDDDDDEWQQIPPEWLEGADDDEEQQKTRSKRRRVAPQAPVLGTRVSARMASKRQRDLMKEVETEEEEDHADDEGEEAHESADEAELADSGIDEDPKKKKGDAKTGLESDDESELTQLSDEDDLDEKDSVTVNETAPTPRKSKQKQKGEKGKARSRKVRTKVRKDEDEDEEYQEEQIVEQENEREPDSEPEPEPEPEPEMDANFVEWEMICVTLEEWEEIATRFQGATHYLEKALHKVLSQEIVPFVVEELKERERQRQKELQLLQRKRSTRIAVRETEKEAARVAAIKQAEEEEKMARTRRMEARTAREEEERRKRDEAREQRRKEREERELKRAMRKTDTSDMDVDVSRTPANDTPEPMVNGKAKLQGETLKATKGTTTKATSSSVTTAATKRQVSTQRKSGKKKLSEDDWELDCEVCGSKGINRDEDVALMSCGICNRWQHIPCHDRADARAGRPKRNWDVVDFTCQKCLEKRGGGSKKKLLHVHPQSSAPRHPSLPQPAAYPPYSSPTGRTHAQPYLNGHHGYGLEEPTFVPAYSKRDIRQTNTAVTFAHYQPLQQGFRAEAMPRLLLSPQSNTQTSATPSQSHPPPPVYPPYTNGHASLGLNGYGNTRSTPHASSSSTRTPYEATATPHYSGHHTQLPPIRTDHRPAPTTNWIPYSSPGTPQQQPSTQFHDGYPSNYGHGSNTTYHSHGQPHHQQPYQNHYPHQPYAHTPPRIPDDRSPQRHYLDPNTNGHGHAQPYVPPYPVTSPGHLHSPSHSQVRSQQPESRS